MLLDFLTHHWMQPARPPHRARHVISRIRQGGEGLRHLPLTRRHIYELQIRLRVMEEQQEEHQQGTPRDRLARHAGLHRGTIVAHLAATPTAPPGRTKPEGRPGMSSPDAM